MSRKRRPDEYRHNATTAQQRFVELSRAHHSASLSGDYRACNVAVAALTKVARQLVAEPASSVEFAQLLAADDPAVAIMAALYLGKFHPQAAVEVLRKLSGRGDLVGLQAATALKRWDSGQPLLDWK